MASLVPRRGTPIIPITRLRFVKKISHNEGIEIHDVPNGENEEEEVKILSSETHLAPKY